MSKAVDRGSLFLPGDLVSTDSPSIYSSRPKSGAKNSIKVGARTQIPEPLQDGLPGIPAGSLVGGRVTSIQSSFTPRLWVLRAPA